MKSKLLVAATAFLIALSAAGCGESVEESCRIVCEKLVGCVDDDPDELLECREDCLEDAVEEQGCIQALEDMSSCISNVICTDIENGVACLQEQEVLDDDCRHIL